MHNFVLKFIIHQLTPATFGTIKIWILTLLDDISMNLNSNRAFKNKHVDENVLIF